MPRMGRVVLPNYPHHVVQRGHNRQVVFAVAEDYQRYLTDLCELKDAFGVKVYAYCLMTNHVHLLLAPGDSAAGLKKGTDLFSRLAVLNKSPFAHRRTVRLTISLPNGGLLSKLSGNLLCSVLGPLINIV